MREKLTLLGPLILIPLAVVLTMLALEPPPKTPKIVFFVEPTATITPRPTPTPIPPTPTFTPTALPTATPILAATATAPLSSSGSSFSADIQPILNEHCVKCHTGDDAPPWSSTRFL